MIPLFVITCTEELGALVMSIDGEVDANNAAEFLADFLQHAHEYAHHKHLVVDLSPVIHFALRGLDVLEEGQRHLRQQARDVILVVPPGSITRRVLDIVSLREQMPVLDTLPQAVNLAQQREGLAGGSR